MRGKAGPSLVKQKLGQRKVDASDDSFHLDENCHRAVSDAFVGVVSMSAQLLKLAY